MISILLASVSTLLLADVGPQRLWYAAPLLVSVSLVYAATRHEYIGPILGHAVRFFIWIVGFMLVVLLLLQTMIWLAG